MSWSDYTGSEPQLVPQDVTGYRAWRAVGHTIELRSCGRNYYWRPGLNQAECINGHSIAPHIAPGRDCTCGFYARTADDLHGYGMDGIQGIIKASGRTVLGRNGFRAERARIVALYGSSWSGSYFEYLNWENVAWANNFPEAREKLADYYGVPFFSTKEEAFEAFPPDDLSALLPPGELNPRGEIRVTRLDVAGQPISGSAIYATGYVFVPQPPSGMSPQLWREFWNLSINNPPPQIP